MTVQPPESIRFLFCPECGRDDRFKHLSAKAGHHYAKGGDGRKCPGRPKVLRYWRTPDTDADLDRSENRIREGAKTRRQ